MIINVNGFQFHYEERGGGDPLLLLHGGTGSGSD
jgi:pimeloyl-ACP methyl ester carboxylesterase